MTQDASANTPDAQDPPILARRIGLGLLTFYGLGTILGAGIYVLVGKVAGSAGLLAPLAFIVSALVAGVTAFSYSQLVVRYPKSAGEAYYVEQSFRVPWLSILVGYLVVFTGVVSAATLANGFVGYLSSFIAIPHFFGVAAVVLVMGAIAFWGIAESLWLAAVITVVEISGLILVVMFAGDNLVEFPQHWQSMLVPSDIAQLSMVISGAFLAFYAFVGFEDMVNVVEEVKSPERNMPSAIILALGVSTFLYVLVAIVAVLGMPLDELVASKAPLRELLETDNPNVGKGIAVISLFAIVNGVLTQIIMASRVLYGMARQGRAPEVLADVSKFTKTPSIATFIVVALIFGFALWLPLVALAKTTSFIILVIFTLVNVALWQLQRSGQMGAPQGLPSWPKVGALLCIGLLVFQVTSLV
ncbi:MAG: amino acid permease [Agarilytica sp.]